MNGFLIKIKLNYWLPVTVFILYNDWVLSFWLNPGLNQMIATVSESSAAGQPFSWVNRLIDCLAGIIILASSYFIYKAPRIKSEKGHWLLMVGYLSIGLDDIIDSILRLNCAPSLVKGCSYNNNPSLLTNAHLVESFIAGTIVFVVPVLWYWLNRQTKSTLKYLNLGFAIYQLCLGICVIIEKIYGSDYFGIPHRFYLVGIGLWVAILLWLILNDEIVRLKTKNN